MDTSRDLEYVSFTDACVLPNLRVIGIVGAVAHHVFAIAVAASSNCNALVFVSEEVERVIAAFALRVGKIVDRVSVQITIPRQFLAEVSAGPARINRQTKQASATLFFLLYHPPINGAGYAAC